MSVSDPLIYELKRHTLELVTSGTKPIYDCDTVKCLCDCIERIFNTGLIVQRSLVRLRPPDCWYWLEQLGNDKFGGPYSYVSSVEKVQSSSRVTTSRGRVRLLIRMCLNQRCIHFPVQFIRKDGSPFYSKSSIIGDDILCELFLSVLRLLSKFEFKLDVENCLFLDKTWDLPLVQRLHLVPCHTLGLTVSFVEGKAIVIGLLENSVSYECGEIKLGDILENINGVTINGRVQGGLTSLMRKFFGQPLDLYVVKCILENGRIFQPMLPLLMEAELSEECILMQYESSENICPEVSPEITFIGQISTGGRGDVKRIFYAINELLESDCVQRRPVSVHCSDLSVCVTSLDNSQMLFEHSYQEISSCGSTTSGPLYFAYITGSKEPLKHDDNPLSKPLPQSRGNLFTNYSNKFLVDCQNFQCYVFHSEDSAQVEALLKTIGQGFKRTLFTV